MHFSAEVMMDGLYFLFDTGDLVFQQLWSAQNVLFLVREIWPDAASAGSKCETSTPFKIQAVSSFSPLSHN